ncbi:MAG: PEGA domain-containing protein [Sterolibacterium sp.]|jgi:hypothetical protein
MNTPVKLLCLGGVLLLATGCARMPGMSVPNPLDLVAEPSAIHVDVPIKRGAIPLLSSGQAVSLAVADFGDARAAAPGRKIGKIMTTVSNMHGTELLLDRDVAALLGNAARGQLAADGFRLVNPGETADFKLGASAQAFSLNIAGTDELAIAVEVTLREERSGEIIWAGVIAEKADRYAGVGGNSRATIAEYLGEGVAAFAGKLSTVVIDVLAKSYPRTMTVAQHKPASTIPGVTTVHTMAARELLASAAVPVATPVAAAGTPNKVTAAAPPRPAPTATATSGHLSVASFPARAKVYIEDVYHGLTPLKLELPVGVHALKFKLDGYKSASEKVAVRRGETIELEIKFQK